MRGAVIFCLWLVPVSMANEVSFSKVSLLGLDGHKHVVEVPGKVQGLASGSEELYAGSMEVGDDRLQRGQWDTLYGVDRRSYRVRRIFSASIRVGGERLERFTVLKRGFGPNSVLFLADEAMTSRSLISCEVAEGVRCRVLRRRVVAYCVARTAGKPVAIIAAVRNATAFSIDYPYLRLAANGEIVEVLGARNQDPEEVAAALGYECE